jgi:hypothetical protein
VQSVKDLASDILGIAFTKLSMEIKNPISKFIGIENVVTRKDCPWPAV